MRWRVLGAPCPVAIKLWGFSAVTPRLWRVQRNGWGDVFNTTHEDSARFVLAVQPGKRGGRPEVKLSAYTYAAGVGAVSPREVREAFPIDFHTVLDPGTIRIGDWVETEIFCKEHETRYVVRTETGQDMVTVPAITPRPRLWSKAWVYAGGWPEPHAPGDIFLDVEKR
jgi:hypothetical protein